MTNTAKFTLEYWKTDGWYIGRLREVPGVFSQGETLADLEENIQDAYALLQGDHAAGDQPAHAETKEISLKVA